MLPPAARRVIVSLPTSFALLRHPHVLHGTRRLISTAPPATKSRSWKILALRWGLAIGGVYYYNTSNIFAEEILGRAQLVDGYYVKQRLIHEYRHIIPSVDQ